ncbi:hypothetical protein GPJ56_009472 [Histomonas meleagridis]|uniref:uncharacterized protein n=1 Tax=Histomonas meleagridis TaxID=135588 RepID=UPI00355AC7C5|nr:hypothetical protein GPJ56_009472 [Histomonas meleagridis]KAH0798869.1 hypothetical protein GO595_008355 [Histomonas meleagridis]
MKGWDPFHSSDSFFGPNNESNGEFEDAFALALNEIDKDSSLKFNNPFDHHPNFTRDVPQQHRRAVSSPMRIVNSPTQNTCSIEQPPIALSSFDLNPVSQVQRLTREFVLPQQVLYHTIDDPYASYCEFLAACNDSNLTLNPHALGFIPSSLWADRVITFGDIVTNFFQKKSNANSKFSHKLFNALKLSELSPVFSKFAGVTWLTPYILRVDKIIFASLLGIKSIDGSLFHQQGNFPSHGFFEIGAGDVIKYCPPDIDLTGVDFENVRLLVHSEHRFRQGCTEEDIEPCKWKTRIKK